MGSVAQYWLNGYDEAAIAKFSSLMQGVYFLIGHVPFESAKLSPGRYPGMDLYLSRARQVLPARAARRGVARRLGRRRHVRDRAAPGRARPDPHPARRRPQLADGLHRRRHRRRRSTGASSTRRTGRSTATSTCGRSGATSCLCSGRPSTVFTCFAVPPAASARTRGRDAAGSRACPAREGAEHEVGRSGDPVSQLRHPGPALRVRLRPHGRRPRPHLPDLGRVQPRLRRPGLRLGADLLRLRQRRLAELGRASSPRSSWRRRCSGWRWTASSTASSARPPCSSSS